MNLVVTLRGASGSGKSTAVRGLFAVARSVETISDPWAPAQPLYHALTFVDPAWPVFVVGDYGGSKTRRDAT